MREKIKIIIAIIIPVRISLAFSLCYKISAREQTYVNQYCKFNYPNSLDLEIVQEDVLINKDGVLVGSITVYPESEFGSTTSSIVANIYGMHAYLKQDLSVEKQNADLKYCIVICYETSAAQQIKNEPENLDELHYVYVGENGTLVDFCTKYPMDDDLNVISKSIKLIK